ncbi:MAG: sulfatase [Planctomycetota bacterium]|nr:sulfatase [Planctomycetota bacterium]
MIACAFLLLGVVLAAADAEPPPPDIVMIVVDDMGWADPGFMPGGVHETPNMDALAERGIVFTQATSNGPNCSPSRASLITGQWTPRHGVLTVGTAKRGKAANRKLEPPKNGSWLKPRSKTLGNHLGQAGYRTGHVGKWHLGNDPTEQGFEFNAGGNKAGHPKSYFSPYKNDDLTDGPEGESLTDRLTDEAIEFLETEDERPVFLHLSYYAVHTPLQATKEEIAALRASHPDWDKRQATYAAMMQRVDRNIGRLLEHVDENSVVIFCSDNGGLARVAHNGPLRGSKGMLYEGGIRVPLVVAIPNQSPGRIDTPVTLMDLGPTVCDLASVSHTEAAFDGESLVTLMDGQDDALEARSLYWHFPAYLEAGGKAGPWRTTPVGAIREGRWKLMEFFEDGHLELYDLHSDPSESENRANAEPGTRDRLHTMLNNWRESVNAPMPQPLETAATR